MRLWDLVAFAGAALAACNGYEELCERRYSDIIFVGAHNSPLVGVLSPHHQIISVTQQLTMGVKVLQLEVHENDDGSLQLCSGSCSAYDAGPLGDYLLDVESWLQDHPDEVITLLIQNKDRISTSRFDTVFDGLGLKEVAFRPRRKLGRGNWPTLQEMIDDQGRFVIVMGKNHLVTRDCDILSFSS